ncbi:MAG: acyl-CoA dehydrogenase family protein [Bdellovibrionota bacterium]
MNEFILDSDSELLRDLSSSVRKFADSNLLVTSDPPRFRREDFDALAKLGLTGMSVPEQHGGTPMSALAIATAIFDLARAQLGPAIYLSVHLMVSKLLSSAASNEYQTERLMKLASGELLGAFCLTEAEAGSDAANLKTKAEPSNDGYRLTGEKLYITSGGVADLYLVFARTAAAGAEGISAFLVEKSAPGLSFGKHERKMGCEGAPIASVHFDGCFVPTAARLGAEGTGYKLALSGLQGGRVNIAAAACGIGSKALEIAARHLRTRRQFGQPLAGFQGLQFMLSDMATALRASVLLTREAANDLDSGSKRTPSASMAKCFATDSAMRITTDAVQLLGGAGYIAEYEVERLMRDAKMLQIVEGTNQIQRLLIARSLVG